MKSFYLLFHLNLMYSSIEVAERRNVIRRCYWPVLDLVSSKTPIGVELTGETLRQIQSIDPGWVRKFSSLLRSGKAELIGSGDTQMIGPLVPAEVNDWNQKLGLEAYRDILGVRPSIALVNEMVYSPGMPEHYLKHGYRAIIVDENNARSFHSKWKQEWSGFPQVAVGAGGSEIPVIWADSIGFQKFQRYAHGEYSLPEFAADLNRRTVAGAHALYANDAEVFDYRPGRYSTEAALKAGEWKRIAALLRYISRKKEFKFILPSEVLKTWGDRRAGNSLKLESAEQPVLVKKQDKYNVTRWAVTGREDTAINTRCWRIYEELRRRKSDKPYLWRELCHLWSSDYRTHITEKRWSAFRSRLSIFEKNLGLRSSAKTIRKVAPRAARKQFRVVRDGRFLKIENKHARLLLNTARGLAVEKLWFPDVSPDWLCGTVHQGYFRDIRFGADFYSGHFVAEMPGRPKLTDLAACVPGIRRDGDAIVATSNLKTAYGMLRKTVRVEGQSPRIEIGYRWLWPDLFMGSVRLGFVTLNPKAYDPRSLFFEAKNGGLVSERVPLKGAVDHGKNVSFVVSSQTCLGLTDGTLKLGDAKKGVVVTVDKSRCAAVGMIAHRRLEDGMFCRAFFSVKEMDETSRPLKRKDLLMRTLDCSFSLEPVTR